MGLCVIDCRVCPDFVNNFPGNCRSPFPVNVGGCFQQNGMQGQNFFELFFGWLRSFVTHLGFDVVALKGWFASIKITSCEETIMVIGNRLKELRESKQLSQGDIEKRSGLLRCYISRVENGHTVPAVETLEKMARALEVPMYRLFHDGEAPTSLHKFKPAKDNEFGSRGAEADYLSKLRRLLAKMEPHDQNLLLHMAQKVARE